MEWYRAGGQGQVLPSKLPRAQSRAVKGSTLLRRRSTLLIWLSISFPYPFLWSGHTLNSCRAFATLVLEFEMFLLLQFYHCAQCSSLFMAGADRIGSHPCKRIKKRKKCRVPPFLRTGFTSGQGTDIIVRRTISQNLQQHPPSDKVFTVFLSWNWPFKDKY